MLAWARLKAFTTCAPGAAAPIRPAHALPAPVVNITPPGPGSSGFVQSATVRPTRVRACSRASAGAAPAGTASSTASPYPTACAGCPVSGRSDPPGERLGRGRCPPADEHLVPGPRLALRPPPRPLDRFPLLGPTGIDGLYVETGTYRDGFHSSPVIARLLAELIMDPAARHELLTPFATAAG